MVAGPAIAVEVNGVGLDGLDPPLDELTGACGRWLEAFAHALALDEYSGLGCSGSCAQSMTMCSPAISVSTGSQLRRQTVAELLD